jgi:DNA-binding MarR family transcriptional regulator
MNDNVPGKKIIPSEAVLDPCLCNEVKKLSRLLGRIYDAALAPTGVSITQLSVLRVIARLPNETMARIAEALEMDRTTFYRAVTPMLRDGWLKPSEGADARSKSISFTIEGKRVLAQAEKQRKAVQKEVVSAYGNAASSALFADLEKLRATLTRESS